MTDHLIDRLAPGWLVVQLLGTAILVTVVITAAPANALLWTVYGIGIGCWLAFIGLDQVGSRWAVPVLVVSIVVPALAVGPAPDATALVICCVLLGRLASLPEPSGRLILWLFVYCEACTLIGCLLWRRSTLEVFGSVGMVLLLTVLGLNRRQYQLRARQAEELLAQTRLAQQEQSRAAALDERARIAREMHDVLAHSLGALTVQLDVAEALLDKGDAAQASERVRRANRLAREGLTEARDAVAALRRDGVPSLSEALAQLAEAHRRDHGPVDFHVEGAPRQLPSAAAVSLVRAAREALTNAARHAPGAPVTMALAFDADHVTLTVANAVPEDAPVLEGPRGYGLTGMRERLVLVGGTLDAGGVDRWLVTATVPA
ncbi:sensor histidine kinase [Labedaea rhizosphaerae]|uniref:histidine kinase n=1 Tax=Labedaea rhizosphaerae TaxID=598644 RepID=A0A4R6S5G6_LABRH|nr:histidine kinase [Labedaea rhizosphaerae]TDP93975.1 histidine kinase [Labedaea rhizosphaerae]